MMSLKHCLGLAAVTLILSACGNDNNQNQPGGIIVQPGLPGPQQCWQAAQNFLVKYPNINCEAGELGSNRPFRITDERVRRMAAQQGGGQFGQFPGQQFPGQPFPGQPFPGQLPVQGVPGQFPGEVMSVHGHGHGHQGGFRGRGGLCGPVVSTDYNQVVASCEGPRPF